ATAVNVKVSGQSSQRNARQPRPRHADQNQRDPRTYEPAVHCPDLLRIIERSRQARRSSAGRDLSILIHPAIDPIPARMRRYLADDAPAIRVSTTLGCPLKVRNRAPTEIVQSSSSPRFNDQGGA